MTNDPLSRTILARPAKRADKGLAPAGAGTRVSDEQRNLTMAERKPRTTTTKKKTSTEAGEAPARRKTPKRISDTGAVPKTTTKSRAKKTTAAAGNGEASAAVPKTTTKSRTRKKA